MTDIRRAVAWAGGFIGVASLVLLAVVTFQVEARTDQLQTIRESAERIEEAALETEQILVDVIASTETPEAVAQQEAVRDALSQIRSIHNILCADPQFGGAPECADG